MNRWSFLGLAAALAVGACASTQTVSSDIPPGANLAAYKSFTFINPTSSPSGNPVAYERVRRGVETALMSKGYAESNSADLSVIITLGKQDKTDVVTYGFGAPADVYQYTEGKVSVDVFNTNTRRPLWHGQTDRAINPSGADPATIDAAVASMMAKFPARS
jgi:hypothetical protein